jgi:uncharacterized integral membrane protein (TIGR00697 family)
MVPRMAEGQAAPARGRYSQWFVIVVPVFVTCLITANITAVKLINLVGFILPAGVIVFPISYIAGDVLTEVYGFRRARQVIWLGFFCNLIAVLAIWLGEILPPAPVWDGQGAYEQILGYTPRLLFASFLAYLVGEFTNSIVLSRMKVVTEGFCNRATHNLWVLLEEAQWLTDHLGAGSYQEQYKARLNNSTYSRLIEWVVEDSGVALSKDGRQQR